MGPINTEKLKVDDMILTYDPTLLIWIKCKIVQIEKYLITLEALEGTLKGIPWYVFPETLKDPDYYRTVRG
ncbi:unnamed protein product [marine sediment metagenome]